MSNFLISILFAAGTAAWVYNKMSKRTMGNTQVSLTIGGVVGLIVLLVAWTLLNMFMSN